MVGLFSCSTGSGTSSAAFRSFLSGTDRNSGDIQLSRLSARFRLRTFAMQLAACSFLWYAAYLMYAQYCSIERQFDCRRRSCPFSCTHACRRACLYEQQVILCAFLLALTPLQYLCFWCPAFLDDSRCSSALLAPRPCNREFLFPKLYMSKLSHASPVLHATSGNCSVFLMTNPTNRRCEHSHLVKGQIY